MDGCVVAEEVENDGTRAARQVKGYYDALLAVGLPTSLIEGLVSEYHRLYWQAVLGEIGQGKIWDKHLPSEIFIRDYVNMTSRNPNGRG